MLPTGLIRLVLSMAFASKLKVTDKKTCLAKLATVVEQFGSTFDIKTVATKVTIMTVNRNQLI